MQQMAVTFIKMAVILSAGNTEVPRAGMHLIHLTDLRSLPSTYYVPGSPLALGEQRGTRPLPP